MKKIVSDIDVLKQRLKELSHLAVIQSLMGWDQEVNMPTKASDVRASAEAELGGIMHNKYIALDHDGLLTRLRKGVLEKKIQGNNALIVTETWRGFERESKLPEAFVREVAEVTSKAQHVWAKARKENNFKLFLPYLTRIVKLKRQEAQYVGYKNSPYDALLDVYEPGMTTEEASMILNDLKDFLVPFLKSLQKNKKKPSQKNPKGTFELAKQVAFNTFVAQTIGFDFSAGRIDASTHPFTTGAHPYDVRLTTRYKEDDVLYALGSTIHEAGHGMYEQGLPVAHFGTPLAEAVSLGIHESQSRLWENHIGKSGAFWKHMYPKLQKKFPVPYKNISFSDFYQIINSVRSSLIRTESDEVTYNLHIIMRFEIEKELIEGSIEVKDLPKIWYSKMKEYLGIEVPTDALGVLQDVHWSAGLIGYFPTYSFGNLYAAQFYATMEKDIPRLNVLVAGGKFTEILSWLRRHIHSHGKTYTASALIKKVTGEPLNSRYFVEYLEKKYGK